MRSSSDALGFQLQPDDVTATGAFVSKPLAGLEAAGFTSADASASASPPEPESQPDLESVRHAAFEEGREAGRAELPWQEARQLETAIVALESAERAFAAERRDYLRAQRGALVDLAIAIAERILMRELSTDPAALVALVERAIDSLPQASRDGGVALHLSPSDHGVLAQGEGDALARLAQDGTVQIVSDAGLAPGDVRVQAGATTLDARRSVLLERVREALAPALDAASNEPAAAAAGGNGPTAAAAGCNGPAAPAPGEESA